MESLYFAAGLVFVLFMVKFFRLRTLFQKSEYSKRILNRRQSCRRLSDKIYKNGEFDLFDMLYFNSMAFEKKIVLGRAIDRRFGHRRTVERRHLA